MSLVNTIVGFAPALAARPGPKTSERELEAEV
jgi:hypothetical protein